MATVQAANQKSIQQIIDSTSKATGSRNTGQLGKDDFLNLLITQLRYQDPLKPMDDKEFIGQMAQFSALEQMQNMNTSFSSVKAFSMIGKNIKAILTDEKTGENKVIQGVATSVKVEGGKTFVVVKGSDIPIDKVAEVSDRSSTSETGLYNYSNLVGHNVKGAVYDSQTGEIIGITGSVASVEKGAYEDYASLNGVKVDLSEIISDTKSTDPNFIKDTLEKAVKDGTELSFYIVNRQSGQKVPITAKIRSYSENGGRYSLIADNVLVPVESISSISGDAGVTSTNSVSEVAT